MNRIVYTSFLLGASFASTEAQVNTPPNIVLILCDDMGFTAPDTEDKLRKTSPPLPR